MQTKLSIVDTENGQQLCRYGYAHQIYFGVLLPGHLQRFQLPEQKNRTMPGEFHATIFFAVPLLKVNHRDGNKY